MAQFKSLGVHTPVGLPYLIEEGILPEDPKQELYQWETYVSEEENVPFEDEVLATRDCVVWSRGIHVREVYRSELEGENVVQAILTRFPPTGASQREPSERTRASARGVDKDAAFSKDRPSGHRTSSGRKGARHLGYGAVESERALVIFLDTKAHVHFLNGPSHIVELPFEIDRAFPAPRGFIVQRKPLPIPSPPSTPPLPLAPPNSFFSSQIQPSSSLLQSPTLVKSFASSQTTRPGPLGGGGADLDTLYNSVIGSSGRSAVDDLAPLYSLTSPLSDFGVITYSLQHQKPRLSSKTTPGLSVEFETLDAGERVVYVSSQDELGGTREEGRIPYMLIVTTNNDLHTLTVWHGWYIDERSLASLMKQREAHKAAKTRRRSSFLSTAMATGTATPAVKPREGTRESFAAAGSMRLPSETVPAAASSRKPTRQEEEEAMASQMDPNYQPSASQQNARESRRISSLNTDIRGSQTTGNAGTIGPGGRRNTSFGGPNERRSFGHRRSRGSTPGSVFSRSLGLDDDLMDLDSSMDGDDEESVESIVRHVRATIEAAGIDSVLGSTDEGFKNELIVRKLHSFPIVPHPTSSHRKKPAFRIETLRDEFPASDREDVRMGVFIHEQSSKTVSCFQLLVRPRPIFSELQGSLQVVVPVITSETKLGQCDDILKLNHCGTKAILFEGRGLIFTLDDSSPCPLPAKKRYRAYNACTDFALHQRTRRSARIDSVLDQFKREDVRIGSTPNRHTCEDVEIIKTLPPPEGSLTLLHPGPRGSYDEVGADGVYHRRHLALRPTNDRIQALLDVCQAMLPQKQASMVASTWCVAYANLAERTEGLGATSQSREWVAFVTTLWVFVIHLIDPKAQATLRKSRIAAGKFKTSDEASLRLAKQVHEKEVFARPAWSWMDERRPSPRHVTAPLPSASQPEKDQVLLIAAATADELLQSGLHGMTPDGQSAISPLCAAKLMIGLHIYREDSKLFTLSSKSGWESALAPVIAQLGSLLGSHAWGFGNGTYMNLEGASEETWSFVKSTVQHSLRVPLMEEPIGILQWFEHAMKNRSAEGYLSLLDAASIDLTLTTPPSKKFVDTIKEKTPRITALSKLLASTAGLTASHSSIVEQMAEHGVTIHTLETLPEAVAAPFREAIARCEREPPTTWPSKLLELVGREDLHVDAFNRMPSTSKPTLSDVAPRDIHSICQAADQFAHSSRTREASRHAVSQLIFSEDRRLVDTVSLMHFNSVQVAECPRQPDWSDAYHFEQQRKAMQWVTIRMIALPTGDGMIHFDSQSPLFTEKYHLPGFNSSCLMQPMGHTLTADRSGLTEEKVNWAYFHAGVSVGLRISRNAGGIDTSWVAFNKPNELTNRHAGLLLALGLNGHLRHLAKWLSFKYLTPKHTMTSVGLLLGLSASYMGTMDGLVTRMLSVHITRMLPPGAAELNVSPITQTAGLMGIGLLYYKTQHRRMSEIMLSEIEHMELEDPDSGPDPLRDESYRLAAGFALGYINLGKGKDLRGLHGMHLPERLLAVAIGPRPVSVVHVFDRATAGAVIGLALVYMKSGDKSLARKIDIPDTEVQFDHVRPDMLMLRAMAKHIILWDTIIARKSTEGTPSWIQSNLPVCYQSRFSEIKASSGKYPLKSSDVPFFNVATGLSWALSLKYAGSGNLDARDEILAVLDHFYMMRTGAEAYYYDAKLARSAARRCIDVLALSAATVMAGTGDLQTFRYLRRLHGRTDGDTPYGSHFAAHMAIGTLFLGGGTYTFGTSNLAIASLMCSFYPLFPIDVHDNNVHMQAFRHLWVFAADARCLVVEDIDTQRPISMPISLTMTNGETKTMTAPCLLPELDQIKTLQTGDPSFWRATLDFAQNAAHLAAFRKSQRILVRRCPASEAHNSAFSATLAALNDAPYTQPALPQANSLQEWHALFSLPAFKDLDKDIIDLILPPDTLSPTHGDERGTVVDNRLALTAAVNGKADLDDLWDLRILFAWAARARDGENGESRSDLRWIGHEVIDALQAKIEERRSGRVL